MAAVHTGLDMAAEGGGATVLDRRHDLEVLQAQMPSLRDAIGGSGGTQNVGDLERSAHCLS